MLRLFGSSFSGPQQLVMKDGPIPVSVCRGDELCLRTISHAVGYGHGWKQGSSS